MNFLDWLIVGFASVGGVSGVSSLIMAWSGRRKTKSEAADIVTDATTKLLKPLTDRIDELETEMKTVKGENKELKTTVHGLQMENAEFRAGIALLSTQIVSLGQKPMYEPKKS